MPGLPPSYDTVMKEKQQKGVLTINRQQQQQQQQQQPQDEEKYSDSQSSESDSTPSSPLVQADMKHYGIL